MSSDGPRALPAVVIELTGHGDGAEIPCRALIAAAREAGGAEAGGAVLVRTGRDGARLDSCCARWLITEDVALVGIDGPRVGDERVAGALRDEGIVIVESMTCLDDLPGGAGALEAVLSGDGRIELRRRAI